VSSAAGSRAHNMRRTVLQTLVVAGGAASDAPKGAPSQGELGAASWNECREVSERQGSMGWAPGHPKRRGRCRFPPDLAHLRRRPPRAWPKRALAAVAEPPSGYWLRFGENREKDYGGGRRSPRRPGFRPQRGAALDLTAPSIRPAWSSWRSSVSRHPAPARPRPPTMLL
jgi:hypothetical protein